MTALEAWRASTPLIWGWEVSALSLSVLSVDGDELLISLSHTG